jgi:hypothetical protein
MRFNAARFQGKAAATQIGLSIWSLTAQLACGADIYATAAQAAFFGFDIERSLDLFLVSA